MSRNIKNAQHRIFGALDAYCTGKGIPVLSVGTARYISGDSDDSRFLAGAEVQQVFRVTPRRTLLRIQFKRTIYFCSVGCECPEPPSDLIDEELTPGQLAVILSEAPLRPVRTALEISNALGDANTELAEYQGHSYGVISGFYGPIKVFSGEDIDLSETWPTFFEICIGSTLAADTWIEDQLASDLRGLASLSKLGIPFQTLCRSIFDADPASLFLALYRCLEALYAYSAATKLAAELNIKNSWTEIAVQLEKSLGWRPREEDSLLSLIKLCEEPDLESIFVHLGEARPVEAEVSIAASATRRIYSLRNALVHFRPVHHTIEHKSVDWGPLCSAITKLIGTIYFKIQMTKTLPEEPEAVLAG